MKMNSKATGKASSLLAGLGAGACASLSVTIWSTAVLAYTLENERITWEKVGYAVMVILFTSSFLGAKISWVKIKRQKLVISMLSGLAYFSILLLITALFFGGQYDAVGATLGLVVAGCSSAGLHGLHKRGRGDKTKIRPNLVKLYK